MAQVAAAQSPPLLLPLPKYHRIYLVLREQLGEGGFAAGLPGELALMAQFGVARVTIRRALELLSNEGLISREPGRGTRPVDSKPGSGTAVSTRHANLTGLLENLVSMSLNTSVKVLEVKGISASISVAEALQIEAGAEVQKAVRVRSTREGPLSHITTYVPQQLARSFGRRELSKKPILVLIEESGIKDRFFRQLTAAKRAGQ